VAPTYRNAAAGDAAAVTPAVVKATSAAAYASAGSALAFGLTANEIGVTAGPVTCTSENCGDNIFYSFTAFSS
jgi:hypothetical protein